MSLGARSVMRRSGRLVLSVNGRREGGREGGREEGKEGL